MNKFNKIGVFLTVLLCAGPIAQGAEYTLTTNTASPYGDFAAIRTKTLVTQQAGFKGFAGSLDSAGGSPWGTNEPPAGADGTMFFNSTTQNYYFVTGAAERVAGDSASWYKSVGGTDELTAVEGGRTATFTLPGAKYKVIPNFTVIGGHGKSVLSHEWLRSGHAFYSPVLATVNLTGVFCTTDPAEPRPTPAGGEEDAPNPGIKLLYRPFRCDSPVSECSGVAQWYSKAVIAKSEEPITLDASGCGEFSVVAMVTLPKMRGMAIKVEGWRNGHSGYVKDLHVQMNRVMSF